MTRCATLRRLGPTVALLFWAAVGGAEDWPRWTSPEEAGFSSAALAAARSDWEALPDSTMAAFFLVYKGRVLASFGDETYPYWCHSVRKSLLSTLIGLALEDGEIDLDDTLEELGIDDSTPLTATEKQARVRHLVKARSGVYLPAACETPEMRDARPERGSHAPDTFWYYNNWDFNALGTIYRQETGRGIFSDFERRIGDRIGMQDFQAASCEYVFEPQYSSHPCYTFRMSVRDRARFGQLFLQGGVWNGSRVIPPAWVEESTRAYSETGFDGLGYGYMWWIYSPRFFELTFGDSRLHRLRGFSANGYGGQLIMVLPDADMILVFGVDVPAGGDLTMEESLPMVERILTGRQIVDLGARRVRPRRRRVEVGDKLPVVAKVGNFSAAESRSTAVDFYLVSISGTGDEDHWIGRATLRSLAAGQRRTIRLRPVVPSSLVPGDYNLVVVVDGDHATYDLNRSNNLQRSGRGISIGPAP